MSKLKAKLISTSHHRNGVSGDPFQVTIFEVKGEGKFVAFDFGAEAFGVLKIDLLAQDDIAFGSNSWRGEHYMDKVRTLVERAKPAVKEGSLYMEYPLKPVASEPSGTPLPEANHESPVRQEDTDRCDECGLPIPNMPEDATPEERLCDKCYLRGQNSLCHFFTLTDYPSEDYCNNPDAGAYKGSCIGIDVCTQFKEA